MDWATVMVSVLVNLTKFIVFCKMIFYQAVLSRKANYTNADLTQPPHINITPWTSSTNFQNITAAANLQMSQKYQIPSVLFFELGSPQVSIA